MQIIKVPSVYSCKLPGGEWLNLALIRRIQIELDPPTALIEWENGDRQVYKGLKAMALAEAWAETQHFDKSSVGFVDGQLLGNGATPELVAAVIDADDRQISLELLKVEDLEQRDRLTSIIQRLGEIQGVKR